MRIQLITIRDDFHRVFIRNQLFTVAIQNGKHRTEFIAVFFNHALTNANHKRGPNRFPRPNQTKLAIVNERISRCFLPKENFRVTGSKGFTGSVESTDDFEFE